MPAIRSDNQPHTSQSGAHFRPQVRGKFLFVGDQKLFVRGVTYGTFRPGEGGAGYCPDLVEVDFAHMALKGINAVRTYTVPPRWVLDAAQRRGLRVMVGLPWEQHVAFLDDRKRARDIEARVRAGVRACAGHPGVLCYVIGNEIPTGIVRWHGRRAVEDYLERLYAAAKDEDPGGLVTYVNYPSTEYLELPFLDFACFNVYLESQDRLEAYLARLHNLVDQQPLVMGEIGLDSRRNGTSAQASSLDWQIRTAFAAGCAGAFVFAWTDEWHRGGYDINDWDFGLTDRARRPKPALATVSEAFAELPLPSDFPWPRVSVVVCSYNGERTIRECLAGLQRLEYPDFEVIVVDDGSGDATAVIAREHGVQVISTENRGLSSARNTGLEVATGEIVAYIDDDASPDRHWLTYLAATFLSAEYAGVGGPNLAPAGDGPIADCVANAPGGPNHVLISDREAEHVPGCNMAFRKTCLQAIGGFDPQFRTAGDDVDVCWRLQERGWKLGFSPAAMVWHHRRNSVRAYWRQQVGYGKAEALLERKWPEKYNSAGHLSWAGRLYGRGLPQVLGSWRGRIYQGRAGSAPFQSVYQPASGLLSSLPLMPEWYFAMIGLIALGVLGRLWEPLVVALPLAALALAMSLAQAGLSAARARFSRTPRSRLARLKLHGLTTFLHLVQPLARLRGRLRYGLTPWRQRGGRRLTFPWPHVSVLWSERWQAAEARLRALETGLRTSGVCVRFGGDYDRWDLEVRGGLFGAARTLMAVEDHGAGMQLVRLRSWPRCSAKGIFAMLVCLSLGAVAARDGATAASIVFASGAALLALFTARQCASSMATILHARADAPERAPQTAAARELELADALVLGDQDRPNGMGDGLSPITGLRDADRAEAEMQPGLIHSVAVSQTDESE